MNNPSKFFRILLLFFKNVLNILSIHLYLLYKALYCFTIVLNLLTVFKNNIYKSPDNKDICYEPSNRFIA